MNGIVYLSCMLLFVNSFVNNYSPNSTLTNYLKTKRVQVTPTPNAYIPPFTHYVTFDYSQYGITKDKIISIMVESTSTGSAVAYLGAGTSIHVHANTNDTRYVTIVYLGN